MAKNMLGAVKQHHCIYFLTETCSCHPLGRVPKSKGTNAGRSLLIKGTPWWELDKTKMWANQKYISSIKTPRHEIINEITYKSSHNPERTSGKTKNKCWRSDSPAGTDTSAQCCCSFRLPLPSERASTGLSLMAPHRIWLLQTHQTSTTSQNIFWVYQARLLQSSKTLLRSANVRVSSPPTFPPKQHHQAWTGSHAATTSPWVTPQSYSVLFFHANHFYTVSPFLNTALPCFFHLHYVLCERTG